MSSPSRSRTRRPIAWAGLTLAWLLVLALVPATLQGQEPKKDAPAAAAPGAAAPPQAAKSGDNMLTWAIKASGPIGIGVVLLSVVFMAMVIRFFMEGPLE